MKKESFEDYITGYLGLTAIEYMDVLQKYRECFAEEVDRRVNEQLDHVVAQTIIKLKMKLRHDIQQEECLMLINKISTYLQTLISLEGKTCYSESTHKKFILVNLQGFLLTIVYGIKFVKYRKKRYYGFRVS
ncbi:hypothetical protein [Ruminococcus sp.]|jgi:hypothetical protein|uniref:hypothetical protein n=1 Tax=Ruminococcus sp. TaxID=41978 RepID=UPI0025F8CE0C|nr:hypothetical protein [Ruminococcus sp.]